MRAEFLRIARLPAIVAATTVALAFAGPVAADGDCPICTCTIADVDGDEMVGFSDLSIVLSQWGPCDGCPGDVIPDGEVCFADMLVVLFWWGPCVEDE